MPTVAMSTPAIAGPKMREPVNAAEFRLTALRTCSSPTISM